MGNYLLKLDEVMWQKEKKTTKQNIMTLTSVFENFITYFYMVMKTSNISDALAFNFSI